jgi:hypothetical protein
MSLCAHARYLTLAVLGLPLLLGAEEVAVIDGASGSVISPFIITNGCVCQPLSRDANKGKAVYEFVVTNSGSFVLQGFVKAPGGETHSMAVNVDGEPDDPAMIWDIPGTSGFTNRLVSWRGESNPNSILTPRKVFTLSQGKHQIIMRGNSGNVELARITVLRLPAAPTGLHVSSRPGS